MTPRGFRPPRNGMRGGRGPQQKKVEGKEEKKFKSKETTSIIKCIRKRVAYVRSEMKASDV